MKRIYTKTGDQGMTRIRGGVSLPKDDIRIETNGTLDELNAVLGVVCAHLPASHPWRIRLQTIQEELLIIMSHVATPEGKQNPKPLHTAELTHCMEEEIDQLLTENAAPRNFLIPGGTLVAAYLHLARTIARRAERRLWTLNRHSPISPDILSFTNRLSDLLFVWACQQDNLTNTMK